MNFGKNFTGLDNWRKLCLILLFLLSIPFNSCAQKVDIYGYFEPQLMVVSLKNEFYQFNSNKLRIDLESDIGDSVTFGANFDFINYSGKTKWNLLDYLPGSVTSIIPPEQESSYNLAYNDSIFLDDAYLKLFFKYVDLTVGKQQISLGTGYAWNPTDVFNFKNLLDPTYEQPGHNAIRLNIPVGSKYSIVTIYTPEDKWKNSGKLLRLKGKISHFDYSVIVIEKEWTFTDYLTYTPLIQKRRVIGGDFAGELVGLGIWGEVAYNDMEITKNFWEEVLGLDYTFRSGTYLMGEYYRNTLGKTDYKKYDFNDWMQFISQEKKAISQDQVYASISYPATDLINIGCSAIVSINDGSVVVVPTIAYNIFQDVDLSAYLNFYLGKEGKTFGKNLGNGGMVRLRIYF